MIRGILFAVVGLLLVCCGGTEEELARPVGPWTYPVTTYRGVRAMAERTGTKEVTRLVGWDEDFYYFDWYQESLAIGRGSGRIERTQFDAENRGALTREKGLITVKNGQVRTLKVE